MNDIFELLKYTLPSIVVLATAYYIIKQMLDRDEVRQRRELVTENKKLITPLRLQAYERIALFLERISPDSLILRVAKPQMKAKQLQSILIASVRREFEHNMSQQIYISSEAWEVVINTKENIIQLVNVAASRLNPEASGAELSKAIIDMYMAATESPIRKALNFVKNECHIFMDAKSEYSE